MSQNRINIKICRITDIHTARYLARMRVDFLGLHAIFGLPQKSDLKQYRQIIKEIRRCYPHTRTVLVTRIEDPKLLISVYRHMPTDFVQISANMPKSEKQIFLNNAKKIFPDVEIFNVLSSKESSVDTINQDVLGDYVVLDKEFAGGTGAQIPKTLTAKIITRLHDKYILLAGGMGRVDVNSWIAGLSVAGVDIMISMEIGSGDKRKDIKKINDYLYQTRGDMVANIKPLPRNKKLSAILFDNSSTFSQDSLFSYDLVLLKADSIKGLVSSLNKLRLINHFTPVSLVISPQDLLKLEEKLKLDNYQALNIYSYCLRLSEIKNRPEIREIIYQLSQTHKLGLYVDRVSEYKPSSSIRLFDHIITVSSGIKNNQSQAIFHLSKTYENKL